MQVRPTRGPSIVPHHVLEHMAAVSLVTLLAENKKEGRESGTPDGALFLKMGLSSHLLEATCLVAAYR